MRGNRYDDRDRGYDGYRDGGRYDGRRGSPERDRGERDMYRGDRGYRP